MTCALLGVAWSAGDRTVIFSMWTNESSLVPVRYYDTVLVTFRLIVRINGYVVADMRLL